MSTNLDKAKLAKRLLDRWRAELLKKKRNKENVAENFYELLSAMWQHSIPYDEVEKLMEEIARAHMPDRALSKYVYKKIKHTSEKTESEFFDDWCKNIKAAAYNCFYDIFGVGEDVPPPEPAVKKGGMSEQEYRSQRRYADAYPVLDTSAVESKIVEGIKDMEEYLKSLGFDEE